MILGMQSKPETAEMSVSSAYFFWSLFTERNVALGHFNVLKNYSHDLDLTVYLQHLINVYKKELSPLVDILNKYAINSSDPTPKDLNIGSSSAAWLDQEIAEVVYRFMKLDINFLLLNLRYAPTINGIQDKVLKSARNSVSRIDNFIRFMKLKNWLFLPPVYPGIPENTTEKAAVNEVFLLWDHLVFRYTSVRQVQIFLTYIEDQDFQTLLQDYIELQDKESKRLEAKLLKFGVVLPQAYPDETTKPTYSAKNFDDKMIFNIFMQSLQDGVCLHGSALQEVTLNDSLREYFIEITDKETDFMLKLAKMGSKKGWANRLPVYKVPLKGGS